MTSARKITVCILAGGGGQRLGGACKALVDVDGQSALARLVQVFAPYAVEILVGIRPEDRDALAREVAATETAVTFVPGGTDRNGTIRNLVAHATQDWIVVHDVARPQMTPEIIEQLLCCDEESAACCGLPMRARDALAVVCDGQLVAGLKRTEVYRLQTPVLCRRLWLHEALTTARAGEDEGLANLLLQAGRRVVVTPGDEVNWKVTYREDLPKLSDKYAVK